MAKPGLILGKSGANFHLTKMAGEVRRQTGVDDETGCKGEESPAVVGAGEFSTPFCGVGVGVSTTFTSAAWLSLSFFSPEDSFESRF
jgi:hypothetical protein